DNFDFFCGLIDRLAKRLELSRSDHNGGGFFGYGILKNRDLAIDIGFGLSAELRHFHAEILPGFSPAGEHDLPEIGCGILNDNRNGDLSSGYRGSRKQAGERNGSNQAGEN